MKAIAMNPITQNIEPQQSNQCRKAVAGGFLNRNHAVEKRSCGASSCDAPVAEGVGDASSPEPAAKPNGVPGFSCDEGVAATFCDEASQLPVAATALLRLAVLASLLLAVAMEGPVLAQTIKPADDGTVLKQ